MKSMSFTVFSYNATVILFQSNPTQPMDGPSPCPSLIQKQELCDREKLGDTPCHVTLAFLLARYNSLAR